MAKKPGEVAYAIFDTLSATGALAAADATPTGSVFRNGAADGTVTVTVAALSTGTYAASFTVPSGYAAGDTVDLHVAATVGGVVTGSPAGRWVLDGYRLADVYGAGKFAPAVAYNTSGGAVVVGGLPAADTAAATAAYGMLDAKVSTRSTYAGGAVASVTAAVTVGTNQDKAGYSGTATNLPAVYPANVTQWGGGTLPTTFAANNLPSDYQQRNVAVTLPAAITVTSLAAGAITAASVAAGALNGKGDWLLGSAYVAPDNADAAAVRVITDKLGGLLNPGGTAFTGTALAAAPGASGGLTPDQSAQLAALGVAVGQLGGGQIQYTGPVAVDGSAKIVQGDDTQLQWTVRDYVGPDLAGAAVTFGLIGRCEYDRYPTIGTNPLSPPLLIVAGTATAVTADGAMTVTYTVPLTAAQTLALPASPTDRPLNLVGQVVATTAGGLRRTAVLAAVTVLRRVV